MMILVVFSREVVLCMVITWYTIEQTTLKLVCTTGCTVISYYFSILDPNTAISAPRGNSLRGFVSSDFNITLVSELVIIFYAAICQHKNLVYVQHHQPPFNLYQLIYILTV